MKPITIKISIKQLQLLVEIFGNLSPEPINSRKVKVSRSILDKVKIRVRKLYVDWEDKIDLFNSSKKISLKLEYFEAHYLEELINISFIFMNDTFTENAALGIQNDINQKLA